VGFLDTQSNANNVEALYVAYFSRAGDGPGYIYWTDQLATEEAAGTPESVAVVNVADAFAVQPEATAMYSFLASPPAVLNPTDPVQIAGVDAFINQVYENLFNRVADAAGETYWQTQILTGAVSIGSAVYAIANGALGSDQGILADKIVAALYFTTATNAANLTSGATFLAAAHEAVAPVVDSTTLAASEAATNQYVASATAPTFTLTTGVDTPTTGFTSGHGAVATAAGSVFNAPPASNPPLGLTNTLNTGDDLEATGAAAGATTLNYTAVSNLLANPPLVAGVTMNGVNAAVITNETAGLAGFSGNITGLTSATLAAGSLGPVKLGLAGLGLNTALTNVTIDASHGFTAWMTSAAFGTGTDAVTVTLGGVDTDVTLNATSGTTGYGTITVASGGSAANTLELDTNATTTSTIAVTGAENLDIFGTALNIANLHTFNGSAATGNLEAWFFGRGTGGVSATGGSGNNDFIFGTVNGTANFTAADSVNGGVGGTNTLTIETETGAILLAGVGSNITHIQTIEQISDDQGTTNVTGATSADMSLAGSATTLALDANYNHNNVTVTNLTDADTVTYGGTGPAGTSTGSELGTLTLSHTTPVGILDTINFTMDSTSAPAALTVDQLVVATTQPDVVIDSTGNAALNQITDVSGVADNVVITGGTNLTFGTSFADGYIPLGGTVDASKSTGNVTTWLSHVGTNAGNAAQTFIAGTGTDLVHVHNSGGDVIDFSVGGKDTVEFNATTTAGNALNDTTHFYNQVLGFNPANDTIAINHTGIPTFYTNTGLAVAAGDATAPLDYTTGTFVDATTQHANYIDIVTPVNTTAGETAQTAFNTAMGTLGAISVNGLHQFLVSYYDVQDSEAVFGTATSAFSLIPFHDAITAGDAVHVVGLVHMTEAQYATFGAGNLIHT